MGGVTFRSMKTYIFSLFILFNSIAFAQQKSYYTSNIGKWQFENFPTHYKVQPAKTSSITDPYTGKLQYYYEYNIVGQSDGLALTMQNNGINPYSAEYYFNGQVVFSVYYFGNSNVAKSIKNMNTDGKLDGPQIQRELKETGGYIENTQVYDNGVLVSINGVKRKPVTISFNNDSLIDGNFKFTSQGGVFEGIANNGDITFIKNYQIIDGMGIVMIYEVNNTGDSLKVKFKEKEKDTKYIKPMSYSEKYALVNKIKFTNSQNHKQPNSAYTCIFLNTENFSLNKFIALQTLYKLKPFEDKIIFQNNLITDSFCFRVFKNPEDKDFFEYKGISNNGYILNISETEKTFNDHDGTISELKRKDYSYSTDSLNFLLKICDSKELYETQKDDYFYFDKNVFNMHDYSIALNKRKVQIKNREEAEKVEQLRILKIANDSLTFVVKHFNTLITEYKEQLAEKPQYYTEISEYKSTNVYSSQDKYYKGYIVKKEYLNIYLAYNTLINDGNNSTKGVIEITKMKKDITLRFIDLVKSENYKDLNKELKGITDVNEIKKIVNLE